MAIVVVFGSEEIMLLFVVHIVVIVKTLDVIVANDISKSSSSAIFESRDTIVIVGDIL